jgi:hypothetical protein
MEKLTDVYTCEVVMSDYDAVACAIFRLGYLVSKGATVWLKNGRIHRDGDQPAVVSDAFILYVRDGLVHRDGDEPAFVSVNGDKAWYANGVRHRDNDLPAVINSRGWQSWYVNGKHHRDTRDENERLLPAISGPGLCFYYLNGKAVDSEGHLLHPEPY